jgi:hypothetical protein
MGYGRLQAMAPLHCARGCEQRLLGLQPPHRVVVYVVVAGDRSGRFPARQPPPRLGLLVVGQDRLTPELDPLSTNVNITARVAEPQTTAAEKAMVTRQWVFEPW